MEMIGQIDDDGDVNATDGCCCTQEDAKKIRKRRRVSQSLIAVYIWAIVFLFLYNLSRVGIGCILVTLRVSSGFGRKGNLPEKPKNSDLWDKIVTLPSAKEELRNKKNKDIQLAFELVFASV